MARQNVDLYPSARPEHFEAAEATHDHVQAQTLEDIRRALHAHARWKVTNAERAAVMMMLGSRTARFASGSV